MSARRCKICLTNWPATLKIGKTVEQFLTCPDCDEKTDFFGGVDPIDQDEARSRVLHIRFEAFYIEHAAKQLNAEIDHIK